MQHGSFGGNDHNLVVAIVEHGPYAPWVSHGEGFARACDTAYDVSSVKLAQGGLQHVGHLHVVVYVVCDVGVFQSQLACLAIVALGFAVETMAHEL